MGRLEIMFSNKSRGKEDTKVGRGVVPLGLNGQALVSPSL